MGIRAAWKDDLEATSAELVFGEPIRVPGEFLASKSAAKPNDPALYVTRLRRHFEKIRPRPTSSHGNKSVFIFKDLLSAPHVFVYRNAPKGPLENPYEGPFPVISRHSRHYVVRVRNRDVPISLDRLKPAYIAAEKSETSKPPPKANDPPTVSPHKKPTPQENSTNDENRKTRSGRRVKFTQRYQA